MMPSNNNNCQNCGVDYIEGLFINPQVKKVKP